MKAGTERPRKREKILTAAVSLLRRTHDVKRVSLETIAREAGVSPTTIYNHFGTREALLNEVAKTLSKETLERNRVFVHSEMPFPQKLVAIINGKLNLASQANGEIIEKLVSQEKTMASFVDGIYEQEIRPLWREILADGKRQGYIDPTLDDEVLLVYLDVLKAGFSARPDLLQGFGNIGLIEQLTRLTFYGFLKKDINLFWKEDR